MVAHWKPAVGAIFSHAPQLISAGFALVSGAGAVVPHAHRASSAATAARRLINTPDSL
ncbi:hypothetical protein GCM10009556_062390 [Acrocarpospora pleiomorpha]